MTNIREFLRFDYTQHCLRAHRGNFQPVSFERFVQMVATIKEI